ncbi:hypothetical protein DL93DRAFT_2083373 [Clavulina sp. PMI_390]|nr:hypothetical protein DL93DRAFT_2083373 [Clavulina sp. PMI_390]
MFKALGGPQPSIRIKLEEDSVFLRPSPNPEIIPSEDGAIRGTLTLSLPKPKRIKSISVRMVAHYDINFPGFDHEAGQISLVEAQLQSSKDEKVYDKGEHLFSFTLIVAATSSTFDKSVYSRIIHTVDAVAEGEGLAGWNIKGSTPICLIANPAPAGETSDLNVRIEGFREELGPYSISTASTHLTVGGLMHFDVLLAAVPRRTQIMSVSAAILANYKFKSVKRPSEPPQIASKKTTLFSFDVNNPPNMDTDMSRGKLEALAISSSQDGSKESNVLASATNSAYLNTSIALQSLVGPGSKPPSLSTSHQPWAKDDILFHPSTKPSIPAKNSRQGSEAALVPLATVEPGASYQMTHLARLPNDAMIWCSTLDGTNTPVETKHQLVLEIFFKTVDENGHAGRQSVMRTVQPIVLSSCCCWITSLLVPAYSEALSAPALSPSLSPLSAMMWETNCADVCICMSSKEDLIKEYHAADERLRAEHARRILAESAGGMTTVVSWDDLKGDKFEYQPVETPQGRMIETK